MDTLVEHLIHNLTSKDLLGEPFSQLAVTVSKYLILALFLSFVVS